MTEVEYGGGGTARGWVRSTDQLVCPWGAPSPVYKRVEEGEGRPSLWRALGESYSHQIPPFLVELGALPRSRSRREGKGKEKRRKEGAQPLPLVQCGLGLGGGGAQPLLSLSPKAQ